MNTESVHSNKDGKLIVHIDDGSNIENEHIYIVFMSGGICSSWMLKNLCDSIMNQPNQYFYIVNCAESEKQVHAIEHVVQYYQERNNRMQVTDFKACTVGESFNTIEEWLPKFIRDIFKEEYFPEITINIGFNTRNYYEIKTNDEEINNMIKYPLVDLGYDYYNILKRTLHFTPDFIDHMMICEDTESDGYCKKCDKCKDLDIMLRIAYLTYPVDEVKSKAKQLYQDIFKREMDVDGFSVLVSPDGTYGLVDPNNQSRNCICCPPSNNFKKIIYKPNRKI